MLIIRHFCWAGPVLAMLLGLLSVCSVICWDLVEPREFSFLCQGSVRFLIWRLNGFWCNWDNHARPNVSFEMDPVTSSHPSRGSNSRVSLYQDGKMLHTAWWEQLQSHSTCWCRRRNRAGILWTMHWQMICICRTNKHRSLALERKMKSLVMLNFRVYWSLLEILRKNWIQEGQNDLYKLYNALGIPDA